MIKQRKDKNEPFIIAIYTGLGLWYQQMDRKDGYDGVVHGDVVSRGPLWYCFEGPQIVEIKSSKAKAQLHRLTKNERETKAAIEAVGGKYPIVISGYDALAAIGLHIDRLEIHHLIGINNELSNLKDIDEDILPMVEEFHRDILARIDSEVYER